ncbi:phage integrase N-terminal SAM-like domain-containing protein [Sphingomonas sanguinis]|uniref:phage integrase N-terminal SAM-like domain-containing protein n=1 Tax=Sphingomonas sanguinis TaxID=33051 RepID=UPI001F4CD1E7|nr:phage integrase N-terminal SAM-like domain-containing protein [Sphingomonas sanguinis]
MRSMRARAQHYYVRHVHTFAAFLKRSPDTATAEGVRRFQVHQREHSTSGSVIGATISALRFLFGVPLDGPTCRASWCWRRGPGSCPMC